MMPDDEAAARSSRWMQRVGRANVWLTSIVLGWLFLALIGVAIRAAGVSVPAAVAFPLWAFTVVGIHRVIDRQGVD